MVPPAIVDDERPLKYPSTESERRTLARDDGSPVTPFQFKVYDALLKIPPGKVRTLARDQPYMR